MEEAAAAPPGAHANAPQTISNDPGTVLSELQIPPQCTYMHGASEVAATAHPMVCPWCGHTAKQIVLMCWPRVGNSM